MAHKLSKTKGDAKGKSKARSSSTTVENPFSLVSRRCSKEFQEKHRGRLVVKQYVWKASTIAHLDLPVVVGLVGHQKIDYFLQLARYYNEDLTHVFYSGQHDQNSSCFKVTIGDVVYEFTNELWKSLFEITIIDVDDEDEPDPLVMDLHTHVNYEGNSHVNDLLRAPRVEGCYDAITTGQLKMVPRILLWFVSHVPRPKNGGFSIIDFTKIHLLYILLNKDKIKCPHYSVSQMFAIKKCNKGTFFCYVSMITKILNYFNTDIPNITYKSPGHVQEFSQRTLTNVGYFWYINRRAYYFLAGKNARKIYNFDDPVEFCDEEAEVHMDDE